MGADTARKLQDKMTKWQFSVPCYNKVERQNRYEQRAIITGITANRINQVNLDDCN